MRDLKPIELLVLQSTAFCNIDCGYCYLPGRERRGAMPQRVLDRVAEEIVASPLWRPESLLLWHAGEPMTLAPGWYRDAHGRLGAARGRLPRIQFQTNATLLSDAWLAFLGESGAGIGVSLDGPEWLHDRHRRDRSARGTFAKTMRGVALLKAAGVDFTVIATVTVDALQAPDEIFDFFAGIAPRKLAFSIEEAEGANLRSSLYRDDLVAAVEAFFRRLAERNFAAAEPLRIREVEQVIGRLANRGHAGLSQEAELCRIVSVGADGAVAFHSPELLTTRGADGASGAVGNILEQSFAEILAGSALAAQNRDIAAGVAACASSCEYYDFCGGGSPANKLFEHGRLDVTETWYCRLAKQAATRGVLAAIARSGRTPVGDSPAARSHGRV
jgi:uncharacterized protein